MDYAWMFPLPVNAFAVANLWKSLNQASIRARIQLKNRRAESGEIYGNRQEAFRIPLHIFRTQIENFALKLAPD
ncbi:MAG: hypothetical protein C5B59_19980 [Bacteroidetes bacterium]|nr:MAG: hypothetical protein C5B59_19980 [Bacteroidota bacterium]